MATIRGYRWKVYPNKGQTRALDDMLATACRLYNHALAYRRRQWQGSRKRVSLPELNRLLTTWRHEDEADNPLMQLPVSAGQRVFRRLDAAYMEFIKGHRGPPRFRSVRRWDSLQFTYGQGASIRDNRLHVLNVGELKMKWYRPIPEGDRKALAILRRPSGWYVIVSIETPVKQGIATGPAVGCDVGLSHALALSDGTFYDAPKPLARAQHVLRREQRSLARKVKGGERRKQQVRHIARLHERVGGVRRNWWHGVTRALVSAYSAIALENLPLDFMQANHHTARAASDVGLGIFNELLDYKASEAGVRVVRVNAHSTSQICSGCGCIVAKALSERVHRCPECGLVLDRDTNAARNILTRAQLCPAEGNVAGCGVRSPQTPMGGGQRGD